MSLYLVRHAAAGARSRWSGPDLQRPLDARGQAQAEAIRVALMQHPIRRILSSPAVRCTQTVEPLGAAVGVRVEPVHELIEGAGFEAAFDLVQDLAGASGDTVLCSHGDVIPAVLWRLFDSGLTPTKGWRCAKGSIWDLDVRDGCIVAATYRPPLEAVTAGSGSGAN